MQLRLLVGFLLLALPLDAQAAMFCSGSEGVSYKVPAGEVRKGDVYVGARAITIDGTQDGDLLAGSNSLNVSGVVTGDIFWAGQSAFLDGAVNDSVRTVGQSVTVNGSIDGDLLVFAGNIVIGPKAHVSGDVLFFGQQIVVGGLIDGNLKGAGGEATIGGRIGKNATLKCEAVHLDPGARIEGDFSYQARKKLDLEGTSQVGGRVDYQERKEGDEEKESAFSAKHVLWWLYWTLAALVVGLLVLALFRNAGPEIARTVGTDFLGSLGVGFITAIVVPVAAVVLCIGIVTIPLSFLALLLYLVAIYVAKLPVATWLGQWIWGWTGRAAPSPFASLLLGAPILYLLFKIPYLGSLLWLGSLFLGLGAIVLGTRSALRARRNQPGTAPVPPGAALGASVSG